jgi:hypothetical protein
VRKKLSMISNLLKHTNFLVLTKKKKLLTLLICARVAYLSNFGNRTPDMIGCVEDVHRI